MSGSTIKRLFLTPAACLRSAWPARPLRAGSSELSRRLEIVGRYTDVKGVVHGFIAK